MLLMSTIGQRLGISRIKTLEKKSPPPDQEKGPSDSQRSGSHHSRREPSQAVRNDPKAGSMGRREDSLPKTNPTTTVQELQNQPSGESQRSAVQNATEPPTASQKLSVGHEAVVTKDQNGAHINNDPKATSTGNP
jgi:hypothetical protein